MDGYEHDFRVFALLLSHGSTYEMATNFCIVADRRCHPEFTRQNYPSAWLYDDAVLETRSDGTKSPSCISCSNILIRPYYGRN
eukprot:5928634-Pleurochrysis_carterae.AAC.1